MYYWYGENKEFTTLGSNVWTWGIRAYRSRDFRHHAGRPLAAAVSRHPLPVTFDKNGRPTIEWRDEWRLED